MRNGLYGIGLGVLALWIGAYLAVDDGLHAGLARRFGTHVDGQVKQSFVGGGSYGHRHHVSVQFQHSPDEAVTASIPVSQSVYDRYGKDWKPARVHYFKLLKDSPAFEGDDSWPTGEAVRAVFMTGMGVVLVFMGWRQLLNSRRGTGAPLPVSQG